MRLRDASPRSVSLVRRERSAKPIRRHGASQKNARNMAWATSAVGSEHRAGLAQTNSFRMMRGQRVYRAKLVEARTLRMMAVRNAVRANSRGFGAPCAACPDQQFPNEKRTACVSCQASRGPNPQNDGCQDCEGHTFSTSGECVECAAPKIVENNSKACRPSDAGKEPNTDRTACVKCDAGRYSSGEKCEECNVPNSVFKNDNKECSPCPEGEKPDGDRTACEKSCLSEPHEHLNDDGLCGCQDKLQRFNWNLALFQLWPEQGRSKYCQSSSNRNRFEDIRALSTVPSMCTMHR